MKVLGRAETIQQIRVSTPRGHFRFIRLSASTVGTLALWKSGYWGVIISASAFGSKVLQPEVTSFDTRAKYPLADSSSVSEKCTQGSRV